MSLSTLQVMQLRFCAILVKLNPIVVTSLVLPERFSSFIICQKGYFENLPGALLKTGKSF